MDASFVSKARTAFHSAAAKAEKVFADIKKSDSVTHRGFKTVEDSDRQSPNAFTEPEFVNSKDQLKAANPGCIIEDFVRWHSPPDWTESELRNEADDASSGGDLSATRGQLSMRMQKEGNLWRELWETAKPIPAMRRYETNPPLYDEDFAV